MVFSKKYNSKYPLKHIRCHKAITYFCSRIAVVYDVQSVSQKFYQGHKSRITCMDVHPSKMVVATGEASPNPKLHIWSVVSLEALNIIKTQHTGGIS